MHLGFARKIALPDRLAMLRNAGYDCTSLWWPEVEGEMLRLRDSVPEAARARGLGIDHIHVPYRGCDALWSADDGERGACVERHLGFVGDCVRQGVPRMVMHVTLKTRGELDSGCGVESLRRIVDRAGEGGVVVAIENTRHAGRIAELLRKIDSAALGLCYDNAHDALYSAEPGALVEEFGERLRTTHVSDGDGILDRHWLPGDGSLSLESTVEAVARRDDVALLIEAVTRGSAAEAESFLERGMDWARTALRARE